MGLSGAVPLGSTPTTAKRNEEFGASGSDESRCERTWLVWGFPEVSKDHRINRVQSSRTLAGLALLILTLKYRLGHIMAWLGEYISEKECLLRVD